jgi:hypothetical protein
MSNKLDGLALIVGWWSSWWWRPQAWRRGRRRSRPTATTGVLQIVGRRLDDALVLRASAAFEAAAPWRDRWPPVLADSGL